MSSISESVKAWISPPESIATFNVAKKMLADPECRTLCLRSSFDFVRRAIMDIVNDGVDGDIVLVGVWRGGLAIYIQSLLIELDQLHRKLYLCDTFSGFAPPDKKVFEKDYAMYQYFLSLSAPSGSPDEVTSAMRIWDMPVHNVEFLVGDIAVTAENISNSVSFLLVDVDFYSPTMSALEGVHQWMNGGGYVYVDDYGVNEYQCREAVDNFVSRSVKRIDITRINEFAVFWRI